MPRPKPLYTDESAKRTLAHRLTRRADRLRQFNTRFGLRSKRVFLVWTSWSGVERGEGDESMLVRVELLPTPRVSDLTAISRMPYPQGVWPDGTLRVDQISCGAYTEDNLTGLRIPTQGAEYFSPRATPGSLVGRDGDIDPRTSPYKDFFYEIVEDGRGVVISGAPQSGRKRYRLLGGPSRQEGSLYWAINLQRATDDLDRFGGTREDDDDVAPDNEE